MTTLFRLSVRIKIRQWGAAKPNRRIMTSGSPSAPEVPEMPRPVLVIDGAFRPENFDFRAQAHADYRNYIMWMSAMSHLFCVNDV